MTWKIRREEVAAFFEENPSLKTWLGGLSDETSRRYVRALIRYTKYHGMTPQELLELKENGGTKAERALDDYIALAEGMTEAVKRGAVTAIHSFYKHNYLDLAARSGYSKVRYVKVNAYRCPTQEEARGLTLNAHIREDTIVNVISSGGFRVATAAKLVWGDFKELWTWDGSKPVYVFVESKRLKGLGYNSEVEQHCFMTRHACEALLRYAEWYRKRRDLDDDSPLFITRSANKFSGAFTRLFKAGIWKALMAIGDFGPHDLRRFNQTQLEAARVNPNWIKKMQGKKLSGEDNPYSRPKIEQMRDMFKIAEPFLTLAPPRERIDPIELRKQTILDSAAIVFGDEEDRHKLFELEKLLENVKTETELAEVKEFWWKAGARTRREKYRQRMDGDGQAASERDREAEG